MDPRAQPFEKRYPVRPRTHKLLQHVCSKMGHARVMEAWRVENSHIWNNYMQFKASIKDKLKDEIRRSSEVSAAPVSEPSQNFEVTPSLKSGGDFGQRQSLANAPTDFTKFQIQE